MFRQGTRISFILALVFPAIICAALALAYYGYRYAVAASVRSKESLMEGNQQVAQLLTSRIQDRIDQVDFELFQQVQWDGKMSVRAEPVELPPSVESYVVLDDNHKIQAVHPPQGGRSRERWLNYVKGLEWTSLRPWTPSQPGNFRHLHQLFEGKSVLIAYATKKTPTGDDYYVAAKMNLSVIAKEWIPEEAEALAGKRRIAVLDEVARSVFGQPIAQQETPFHYEASFGKTLYAWRVQIAPRNVEELRAQADQERILGVLLIPVSIVIIAVGLGIVWLAVLAERRASRLKSDFIANVSHELKTPLSLIRMFGELLATGKHKGPESAGEYAGIITREAERLAHLIDNVLDFARLERGKASYNFTEGRLEEIVDRALDVGRYRVERDKIRLRTEMDPDVPMVRMDEDAMTLVLLNLLDNAVKYAGDAGEITVSVSRAPGGVNLSVRDRGPGIALDEQRRIFERFYRASTARSRNVRGSGIGLALVKHIAEAHGGRVTVESTPGRGATFSVFVPAAPVAAPAAPEAEDAGPDRPATEALKS